MRPYTESPWHRLAFHLIARCLRCYWGHGWNTPMARINTIRCFKLGIHPAQHPKAPAAYVARMRAQWGALAELPWRGF